MKLTALFLLAFSLSVSANGYGQEKINLRLKKTEISDILRIIEKQTSYRFLYNNDLEAIREKVTINVKDADLQDVLGQILFKTKLLYQLMNDNLVVIKEDPNPAATPDVTIRGKITGDGGAPLPGVSVQVKGTTVGTVSDNSGNFSINAPDANATLVFSSIGYDELEVPLAGQTELAVALTVSTKVIDQVVVVGYGTQRRRAVTGAISSVSGDQLSKQPLLTPIQGVQGLAPGIRIVGSGQPGVQPRVTIRGLNTILTNENPLFVVDGVLTDDITNVNSADVVSIDILKDGAAAIYGSRAGNGVILITTRRGRTGKPMVTWDSYAGVRKMTNQVKMADRNLYLAYTNEARVNDTRPGDPLPPPIATLDATANTDWFDEVTVKGGVQNHNLGISGGSENVTYLFGANYFQDKGIIKDADYKRINFRNNNEFRLTKWFKLGNTLNANIIKVTNKPNSIFSDAYRASPAAPIKDATGNWGYQPEMTALGNPLATLELTNDFGRNLRFQGNFYGELTLMKGLTFRSTWGFDRMVNEKTEYRPVYKYGPFNRTVSELLLQDANRFYWVWDNVVNFRRTIASDHTIDVTAGVTAERDKERKTGIRASNVPPERNLWYLTQGDPTITLITDPPGLNAAFNYQRRSYFGRLNYSFRDKYNLSAVVRNDGSSAFPPNKKTGTFYSFAGSWIISEESFLSNVKGIDFIKLRGGYSRLGNDAISRAVNNELSRLSPVTIVDPYGFPGGLVSGITFDKINDGEATWETTKTIDVGVEFGLLDRKLTGEISYYNKKTAAYIRVPTPPFVDPDGFIAQAADVSNKGFEIAASWNNKVSDQLSYRISANATFNKNNVDRVKGGIDLKEGGLGNGQVTTSTVEGEPIGSFWVYNVVGIFQTPAQINSTPHIENTLPGDFILEDVNKDGAVDTRDRIFVGSYQPKFYYGASFGVNWKAFDFSADLYGNVGNKIFNGKKAVRFGNDNIEASRGDRWTPANTNTNEYRASNAIPAPSTYYVESGTFMRINNITVGYTLPSRLTDRAFMSRARVYIAAQNPLIAKKFSGFSPELQGGNALNSGIELSVYPTVATYMLGININFR
jgi:TonB-linked SusC/RagA family outer membrane protein